MVPLDFLTLTIRPTLAWMGGKFSSLEAERMLLAIALQESGLIARRQRKAGPAMGRWQFELVGINGVCTHHACQPIQTFIQPLSYGADPHLLWEAIEHNDQLACVLARLLLWTYPGALPADSDAAWIMYKALWRPGKPRLQDWPTNWEHACAAVTPPQPTKEITRA